MDYYPTRSACCRPGWASGTDARPLLRAAWSARPPGPGNDRGDVSRDLGESGRDSRVYLNLRTAPVWADLLTALVGILLAMILAIYVLVP